MCSAAGTEDALNATDGVDVLTGDSDGLHHNSAPFWARFGGLVPSRYTQCYDTHIRVSTGWGVVSHRGLSGLWWVGVPVDGGSADSEGGGGLGDGGAGGQESGSGFGALWCPYGGAAEVVEAPHDEGVAVELHVEVLTGGGYAGVADDGGHDLYDTTRVAGDVVLGEVAPLF